ncbi:hypothetical protein [Psychromonas sp. MB-3u-54]|uniref:hypothetical protein n=1 Tax=Psychromonas sp. MB-3u-54 TaxID=2058319 RepID=UPI0012FF120E|nr:hypothetical protein [Psychromonas sp. MB-3u-54]
MKSQNSHAMTLLVTFFDLLANKRDVLRSLITNCSRLRAQVNLATLFCQSQRGLKPLRNLWRFEGASWFSKAEEAQNTLVFLFSALDLLNRHCLFNL